jgi:hypothetical protein
VNSSETLGFGRFAAFGGVWRIASDNRLNESWRWGPLAKLGVAMSLSSGVTTAPGTLEITELSHIRPSVAIAGGEPVGWVSGGAGGLIDEGRPVLVPVLRRRCRRSGEIDVVRETGLDVALEMGGRGIFID